MVVSISRRHVLAMKPMSKSISARTRCTFLTLHLLLERCCCPKLGLSAAYAFDVTHTRDDVTMPSALFRVLLLRLPLPLAPRRCSCRGQLDPLLVPPRESCLPVPCRYNMP